MEPRQFLASGCAGYFRQESSVKKGAISRNASFFDSHRMMRRYAVEAYLR